MFESKSYENPLMPGDIIVQFTSCIKDKKWDSAELLDSLAHCMIYGDDNTVVHSTIGWVRMVRTHRIYHDELIPTDELLGKNIVFRITNQKLREEICTQAYRVVKNPTTKFCYWDTRDTSQVIYDFFRAFRTHHRILGGQSISKNKGISCNQFVSLILKSAIISLMFPRGLPADVMASLHCIETLRKTKMNKKLDQVPLHKFKNFETLIKKYVSADHVLLPDLYQNIKHTSLPDFVSYALAKPDLFEIKHLYYNTDQYLKPCVMDPLTYDALHTELTSIQISTEKLRKISVPTGEKLLPLSRYR